MGADLKGPGGEMARLVCQRGGGQVGGWQGGAWWGAGAVGRVGQGALRGGWHIVEKNC